MVKTTNLFCSEAFEVWLHINRETTHHRVVTLVADHHSDVKNMHQNICGGILQLRFKQMMEVIPSQVFSGYPLLVACASSKVTTILSAKLGFIL